MDRTEIVVIVQSSQLLHGNRTEAVRRPCGYGTAAVRCRVVLDIRVPKMYNFPFLLVLLVEMAPKTKGWPLK